MYAIVNEKGEYVGSTEIKEISDIPMPEKILKNIFWNKTKKIWEEKRIEFQPEAYINFNFEIYDEEISIFLSTVEEIIDYCYDKKIFCIFTIKKCVDKTKIEAELNKIIDKNCFVVFGEHDYFRDEDVYISIKDGKEYVK